MVQKAIAGAAADAVDLHVSIVVYFPVASLLERTLVTLAAALYSARLQAAVTVVDNTPGGTSWLAGMLSATVGQFDPVLLYGHGNIGYGRGHNMTIGRIRARYHLVLNPDVEIKTDALDQAMRFLEREPTCGLLVPEVIGPDGSVQHLCRRYPSVLALTLRGFAPKAIQRRFEHYLAAYEMRDAQPGVLWNPPTVSGCFMLFRKPILRELKGFDERFFLYFEDFDLSIRASAVTVIARVPGVVIRHYGGKAARKGVRHIFMFARSAWLFFNIHGWRWI
ncbi:glycosyl transferase [Zoogloeaceae bacteirum Par-f-2]|nr:glycosyl transferase [Zoogloeaceae bacteirum Par-f-2]